MHLRGFIVQLAIPVVGVDSRVKQLLPADGDKYLSAKLVGPIVEERERAGGAEVGLWVGGSGYVPDRGPKVRSAFGRGAGRVSRSMPMQQMNLRDCAALGKNGSLLLEVCKEARRKVGGLGCNEKGKRVSSAEQ